MTVYSFFVIPESDLTITGIRTDIAGNPPKSLDGLNQGTGIHLIGETITINDINKIEITVDDSGSETNFADNDSGQMLDSDVTIDGQLFTAGTVIEAEYRFTMRDPNTLIEYEAIAINIRDSSPAFATNEAIGFIDVVPPRGVALDIIDASEGPDNSGSSATDEVRIIVCFAKGTLLTTKAGKRPVETLSSGDELLCADNEYRALRWVFRTSLSKKELAHQPKLYPVRITKGSLGSNLPKRDLLVSRQHRMLISSKIALRMFGELEILLPATRLVSLPGIYVDYDVEGIEYFHLLFDRHEIIFAEDAPTESLFTGPEAFDALSPEQKSEMQSLFPEMLSDLSNSMAARLIPPGHQQHRLIARHQKNDKPVLM